MHFTKSAFKISVFVYPGIFGNNVNLLMRKNL